MKIVNFNIKVRCPDNVSVSEMRQYIIDEVRCGKGCRPPSDPIFQMDGSDFIIRTVKGFKGSKLYQLAHHAKEILGAHHADLSDVERFTYTELEKVLEKGM